MQEVAQAFVEDEAAIQSARHQDDGVVSETVTLLETLQTEAKSRTPSVRLALLVTWVVVTAVVALTFAASGGQDRLQGLAVIGSLCLMGLGIRRNVASRRQKDAMRRLADAESLLALPVLVDALVWPERAVHQAIRHALIRLLPRVQPGLPAGLSQQRLDALSRNISHRDPELTVAILRAMERVGGAQEIPAVERLLNRALLSEAEVSVRAAAADCLRALRGRIDREGHLLLRPSEPEPDSAILLQAAGNARNEEPKELLRASVES